MLGPDHFASFETPNVIDPGDAPPVQPKRKEKTRTATTFPPTTRVAKTTLGRTEKIDLGGGVSSQRLQPDQQVLSPHKRLLDNIHDLDLEAPEEDDHVPEHSLPSIDEARNYAASLLQDANRRTPRDHSMEEPSNLATNGRPLMMLPSTQKPSQGALRNQLVTLSLRIGLGILILVIFLLIVLMLR
jgi:hypothetical protein